MRTIKQHTHISHADGLEFYLFALHLLLLSFVFFFFVYASHTFRPYRNATMAVGDRVDRVGNKKQKKSGQLD